MECLLWLKKIWARQTQRIYTNDMQFYKIIHPLPPNAPSRTLITSITKAWQRRGRPSEPPWPGRGGEGGVLESRHQDRISGQEAVRRLLLAACGHVARLPPRYRARLDATTRRRRPGYTLTLSDSRDSQRLIRGYIEILELYELTMI